MKNAHTSPSTRHGHPSSRYTHSVHGAELKEGKVGLVHWRRVEVLQNGLDGAYGGERKGKPGQDAGHERGGRVCDALEDGGHGGCGLRDGRKETGGSRGLSGTTGFGPAGWQWRLVEGVQVTARDAAVACFDMHASVSWIMACCMD